MQALLMGAGNNDVNTEIILNGASVLAVTTQFYNKFPKTDLENEYSKIIMDIWSTGEFPEWLNVLNTAKKNGKLKVYVCQPCIEIFQKKLGKLDLLDIVDGKINGVEIFDKLKNDKDYLFLTV
jgi:peroxiredoxin family protein